MERKDNPMKWTMNTDGACSGNPGPAGIGVWAVDEAGDPVLELSEWIGQGTNNYAEYRAIVRGMELASAAGCRELTILCDSQVVVQQIKGECACRCPHLATERLKIVSMIAEFDRVEFRHIYDDHNKMADRLARNAARRGYNP
jgi:ribonuclease HI